MKKLYESIDGKIFTSESECVKHDKMIENRNKISEALPKLSEKIREISDWIDENINEFDEDHPYEYKINDNITFRISDYSGELVVALSKGQSMYDAECKFTVYSEIIKNWNNIKTAFLNNQKTIEASKKKKESDKKKEEKLRYDSLQDLINSIDSIFKDFIV